MKIRTLFGFLSVTILLAGCGKGIFSKYSPDEFAVASRTPLILPPEYELHPPLPKGSKNTSRQENEAKKALTGVQTETSDLTQSEGEKNLISKTGKKDDPFFAERIEKETEKRGKQENIKIGEVTGEEIKGYDESLDAESEAQRLEAEKK